MNNRHALLAKIHMAKSRVLTCPVCGRLFFEETCPDHPARQGVELSDFAYRGILKALGGTDTCAFMDDKRLVKVADFFDRVGFSKAYPRVSPEGETRRAKYGTIRHIRIRAPVVLGAAWESRLLGFMQKNFDKISLEWLDPNELRKVIGWINRTAKYEKEKLK
ncbi:phage protein GemA/Gp16 family protein [Parasphaerochaeta coccoides]|uniref:Uncharacterized protein n=1 Tax=Parasphaerochaeta coccoides (strain ATCC BAA-1237 / DSM 17374 / SPN1) TaxID=760011 RepID=F4GHU7_PARC1|nr:phage protein GemA/Gp16 family protein [Parasphaerochaeta coccoides]AEC02060.1 hypothetical protein Spico_0836 [Parasphaerochaeta coccoides DSM 17374]